MGKPNNSLAKIKLPGENVQRPIIPYAVSDGTYLASVPTMTKDETLALASNIPSISLVTTEGSESITVNSDTLNLMTTNTNQDCNCYKTFSRTWPGTNNIYRTTIDYDILSSALLDSNEELISSAHINPNGLFVIDTSLNDLSESFLSIQADESSDKICFIHGQLFGTIYDNYLPKKTGTLVVEEDVSAHQSTSVIVGNAVTNINGRVFQNYTATLVTAGGYTFYQILKNGNNPTEEEAKEYMRYMTGSTFLPKYNYDFPKQTVFTFADRSTWKPQYSSNDGLRLYRLTTSLALASDVPSVSLNTTAGSESITVNSNSLNVATRNTAQTFSGTKTFSSSPVLNNNVFLQSKTTGGVVKGLIGLNSGNNLFINNDAQGETIIGGSVVRPCADTHPDLGKSAIPWRDVYLSRYISDGTNNLSIPNRSGTIGLEVDIVDLTE